ncbi:HlyC/CorC family transporter [Candidatus Fermentibacteria bacterium]|nr:HlyC/CorC family transporter [Candidatus Fermentibacteria bacterium]
MMATGDILPQILFVVGLLAASAFFSGSEAALFSLPASAVQRFREAPRGSERAAAQLLRNPQGLLITILLSNLVVNLLATSRATQILVAVLGENTGPWVAWIGMTLLVLVAGETTPKIFALQRSESWARRGAPVLHGLYIVLAPLRALIMRAMAPMTSGWYSHSTRHLLERAELHTAVEEAEEAGHLQPFESDLLLALLDLEEIRVREVMTPRVHIRAIEQTTPVTELRRLVRRLRRTRLPVFAGSVDTIIGMLRANDLAGPLVAYQTAKELARPALFVPENLTLDRLLLRLRVEGESIAVVVDEFGSVAGLVTIHDVVEQVFGPVPDRHDPASPAMMPDGDGGWLVPGTFPLERLRTELGMIIDDDEVETIGGRVAQILGCIPAGGESVELPEGLLVLVTRADSRRVLEVSLRTMTKGISP